LAEKNINWPIFPEDLQLRSLAWLLPHQFSHQSVWRKMAPRNRICNSEQKKTRREKGKSSKAE